MNFLKKGVSVERPPLFDGTNYAYWRVRMREFISTLDEKAWISLLAGWSPPTKMDDEGKIVPKPELEWSSKEDKLENNIERHLMQFLMELILTNSNLSSPWNQLRRHRASYN